MKKLIFFILSLNLSLASAKTSSCRWFLSEHNAMEKTATNTDSLIAYLNYLFENGIVTDSGLKALVDNIKNQSQLINPIPHTEIQRGIQFTQSHHQIHYENFNQYLKQEDLDQQQILEWALGILKKSEKIQTQKATVINETKFATNKMEFRRVKKGRVFKAARLGVDGPVSPVDLPYDIDVMTTPVTQWMWVQEMKKNPSKHQDGPNTIEIEIDGQMVKLQPNNPVEFVTWYAAAQFANHMSRKHGLKEVYDFSAMKFEQRTSLEDGTLTNENGIVKINGPSIYETEGYRLPTESELEFLLSDRSRSDTEYFTGVTDKNLSEYAWLDGNNKHDFGLVTHPVADKKSFIIDGEEFYDLWGNVLELGSRDDGEVAIFIHSDRWYRMENLMHPQTGRQAGGPNWNRYDLVGLRLVRSVK